MVLQLRLLSIVFCVFLIPGTILHSQTDVLRFKRITSDHGLSENKVTAVIQDSEGALWVGNKIAINRFDGENTKAYYLGQNNGINQFFEDSYKNIWAATEFGLYLFNKKKDIFVKVKSDIKKVNKLFDSNVLCVLQVQKNELLISGPGDYLIKFKVDEKGRILEKSIKFLKKDNKYGNVIKIVKDSSSRFWMATNRGEILSIENNSVTGSSFLKSRSSLLINDMATDDFGHLWIATNGDGLFRFDTKNNTIKHFYKDESTDEKTINNNVVTRVYTEGKNVWIGTDGGGLNLYNQAKNSFNYYMYDFGNEFSISDNSVTDIQPGLN